MSHSRLVLLALLILTITGCTAPATQITAETAAPTASVTVPPPTPTITRTPRPTRTPTPAPTATATPVPTIAPPPGLVYRVGTELWQIDANGSPQLLTAEIPEDAWSIQLSPDGTQVLYALYSESGGRYPEVLDLQTGLRTSVSEVDGYIICDGPTWWETTPLRVFVEVQSGPICMDMSYGSIPAAINADGTGLLIMGQEPTSSGWADEAPNGRAAAFDQEAEPWVYWFGIGAVPFNVSAYGFPPLEEPFITHPSWSPSSRYLAWDVSGFLNGEPQSGVGVFDIQQGTSQLYPYNIAGLDGGRAAVRWSADERYIVIINWVFESSLIVAIDGSFEREITGTFSASWSPTDNLIAVINNGWGSPGGSDDDIHTVSVTSVDGSFSVDLGDGMQVIWHPNGQALIFGYCCDHNRQPKDYSWVEVGEWEPVKLDLPPEAYIIDWRDVSTSAP